MCDAVVEETVHHMLLYMIKFSSPILPIPEQNITIQHASQQQQPVFFILNYSYAVDTIYARG